MEGVFYLREKQILDKDKCIMELQIIPFSSPEIIFRFYETDDEKYILDCEATYLYLNLEKEPVEFKKILCLFPLELKDSQSEIVKELYYNGLAEDVEKHNKFRGQEFVLTIFGAPNIEYKTNDVLPEEWVTLENLTEMCVSMLNLDTSIYGVSREEEITI